MKNLYNTLKPNIKLALDENRKTHKFLYQSVKKELVYHEFVRDLTIGTLREFENLIGWDLREDNYYNYWKK